MLSAQTIPQKHVSNQLILASSRALLTSSCLHAAYCSRDTCVPFYESLYHQSVSFCAPSGWTLLNSADDIYHTQKASHLCVHEYGSHICLHNNRKNIYIYQHKYKRYHVQYKSLGVDSKFQNNSVKVQVPPTHIYRSLLVYTTESCTMITYGFHARFLHTLPSQLFVKLRVKIQSLCITIKHVQEF